MQKQKPARQQVADALENLCKSIKGAHLNYAKSLHDFYSLFCQGLTQPFPAKRPLFTSEEIHWIQQDKELREIIEEPAIEWLGQFTKIIIQPGSPLRINLPPQGLGPLRQVICQALYDRCKNASQGPKASLEISTPIYKLYPYKKIDLDEELVYDLWVESTGLHPASRIALCFSVGDIAPQGGTNLDSLSLGGNDDLEIDYECCSPLMPIFGYEQENYLQATKDLRTELEPGKSEPLKVMVKRIAQEKEQRFIYVNSPSGGESSRQMPPKDFCLIFSLTFQDDEIGETYQAPVIYMTFTP